MKWVTTEETFGMSEIAKTEQWLGMDNTQLIEECKSFGLTHSEDKDANLRSLMAFMEKSVARTMAMKQNQ